MKAQDYNYIINRLVGTEVERPNRHDNGTLSGHAAGEPFEKLTYHLLKNKFPNNIYKQYEFLNDLYLKHPLSISLEAKKALIDSPVALFLLSRSDTATNKWNPNNIFEEKQDDTADILWYEGNRFDLIDVKTRNISKHAMAPNIISAYKLARACAFMIDNDDYESVGLHYIEVEWEEIGDKLKCVNSHWRDLFLSSPQDIYINWSAAMQIQFHVSELNQDFKEGNKVWAKEYIRCFVESAEKRRLIIYEKYIEPFKKYIDANDGANN